ncbi:hypothetical protein [Spirosoma daeguense]
MALLWLFWGIDFIAFLATIYFFTQALRTGPIADPIFFTGWLSLLVIPCLLMVASYELYVSSFYLLSIITAAILALPAVCYACLTVLLVPFVSDVVRK